MIEQIVPAVLRRWDRELSLGRLQWLELGGKRTRGEAAWQTNCSMLLSFGLTTKLACTEWKCLKLWKSQLSGNCKRNSYQCSWNTMFEVQPTWVETSCGTAEHSLEILGRQCIREVPLERAWQLTPVFLPGEFHGQRSLAGYSPWISESDTTEETWHKTSLRINMTLHNLFTNKTW